MKDHEQANVINTVLSTVKIYKDTQQLREHLRSDILPHLISYNKAPYWVTITRRPNGTDAFSQCCYTDPDLCENESQEGILVKINKHEAEILPDKERLIYDGQMFYIK